MFGVTLGNWGTLAFFLGELVSVWGLIQGLEPEALNPKLRGF